MYPSLENSTTGIVITTIRNFKKVDTMLESGKLRRNRYKCKLPIKRDRQSWVSPEYGMMQWYCTYNIHHTYTEGQQRHLLVSSVQCRALGGGGQGGMPSPPQDFDRLVNPISIGGPGYACATLLIPFPPDIQTYLRPCSVLEISPFFRADDVIA